jgi:hypothetical protein
MNPPIPSIQIAQPSNLSAARFAALTASLCYAKITPAALHCGEFGSHCFENAEATGGRPEFGLSDRQRRIRGEALRAARPSCMAAC